VVPGHDVESVRPPRHLDRKRKDGFCRKKDVAQTRIRTVLARDFDEHRHFGAHGGRAELVMPAAHFQVILVNLVRDKIRKNSAISKDIKDINDNCRREIFLQEYRVLELRV
jgi:hypothetical protein